MTSDKSRLRLGEGLALAAILVSLPRHAVAQLHQAGMAVPSAPWWAAIVGVSAVAWGLLEALTLFHLLRAYSATRKRHLIALTLAILATIATVNAPSLVADSAGLTLTGLLGVATVSHWVWATASILTTLLVVVAASAADAATVESEDQRQRADRLTQVLTDALDARQIPQVAPVAAAQASVTVNVAQATSPALKGNARQGVDRRSAIVGHENTETRVLRALRAGARTSTQIAAAVGVTPAAVRLTDSWERRKRIWAEAATAEGMPPQ